MSDVPYLVVAGPATSESEIKRSRFIGAVARITSDDEARAFIAERKREHWEANHNCWAYVVGEGGRIQRSSDDGEPAGSAGIPMLSVLQQRGLTDTVAVVTRYFGGTLLGVGGLIRAYGHATSATVDAAGIVERQPRLVVAITAAHDLAGRLEHALRGTSYALHDVEYADQVVLTLQITPEELAGLGEWVAETSNGRAGVAVLREDVVDVPVAPAQPTP